MVRVCPLFSGSSGNSVLIHYKGRGILIDLGKNSKTIQAGLSFHGVELDSIEAVFITHEHSDHISAAPVLSKKLNAPLYATQGTLNNFDFGNFYTQALTEAAIELGEMEIRCFNTPHDSAHSVGFVISAGDRKIGYATDIGEVNATVREALIGCDLVVLEANYEPRLLTFSSYPQILKSRIRSAVGHLSNQQSAEFARELVEHGCTRLILAHLSRENNTPELAMQAVNGCLASGGYVEGVDYILTVAKRDCPTPEIVI